MKTAVIHVIILGVISGLTKAAGVLPDGPLNAAVGETVMFTTTLTSTEKQLLVVSWKFGDVKNIITFSGNTNITEPEYEGRITLFMSTGSLELKNVALSDSGEYRVIIVPFGETFKEGSTRLNVYEKISGASITPSTNLVIDGNSVNLTCDAAGSIFTRKWMKDGSDLILDENVKLHDENRVLSFQPLKKTGSGEYSCKISNPVSSVETKHIMIVNYGPENVKISGKAQIPLGQPLKLTCSAESTPPANYTWKLNGTEIHNSPVFMKEKTEFSDSGIYTCEAMNEITARTSSVLHTLFVRL